MPEREPLLGWEGEAPRGWAGCRIGSGRPRQGPMRFPERHTLLPTPRIGRAEFYGWKMIDAVANGTPLWQWPGPCCQAEVPPTSGHKGARRPRLAGREVGIGEVSGYISAWRGEDITASARALPVEVRVRGHPSARPFESLRVSGAHVGGGRRPSPGEIAISKMQCIFDMA